MSVLDHKHLASLVERIINPPVKGRGRSAGRKSDLRMLGYRPPAAALLSDAGLPDAITLAKQEMLPEFIVSGDFKRVEGSVAIFFLIIEARPTELPGW